MDRRMERTYIAIDLKSFYASVECRERCLDPLTTKLVVADSSRTSKTICLAVTPALKAYGLSGRSRLFEVEAKAREIKRQTGKDLEYITAVPRMGLYIQYSARIYNVYLRYFAPEDIHVYSIDEVFIDATSYLPFYKLTARELASEVIGEIMKETGITATAGIGTNLYLAKIAMDIVAKHSSPNKDGARITRFEDNFLKGFNETNIPKLITNLIACQHYQLPYEELLYKKEKEEEENLIQNVYNNFYRVECDIKNKIKLKELIGHFENKKWESEKYFVLSHNCQTFGAEIVKILKGIRKNEYDKVRIVEKTLLPSCIISALWHNEKLSLVNTLGRIPIFGFFHDSYYNVKYANPEEFEKHNK